MKVGDLVKCIHTGELLIITSPEWNGGYYDVHSATGKDWHMPKEHLQAVKKCP